VGSLAPEALRDDVADGSPALRVTVDAEPHRAIAQSGRHPERLERRRAQVEDETVRTRQLREEVREHGPPQRLDAVQADEV
jgi:hypothetical protein